MITRRLYFDDAYLQQFSAQVIAQRQDSRGQAVALDQSAFYPEGGGQPADLGSLNGVPVVDVQSEGEPVWHVLNGPLDARHVEGQIDWSRRFDHMQQHLGQHLLSAALEHVYALRTLAFHLGSDVVTIDVERPA